MVKNPHVMQESQVQFLGWEDSLEKAMSIHSGIFTWRIPWTEGPGGLQSTGSQRIGHAWATKQQQQKGLRLLVISRNFQHPAVPVRNLMPVFCLFMDIFFHLWKLLGLLMFWDLKQFATFEFYSSHSHLVIFLNLKTCAFLQLSIKKVSL